jgi:hypothetical protein
MAKRKEIAGELPGNSRSSKNPKPVRDITDFVPEPIEPVETPKPRRIARAQVVRKKRSFVQSIAQALVGDGENGVGSYILREVLLPAAKNTIQDMVTGGIEMLLYGETTGRSKRGRDRDGKSVINYSSFSRRDRDDDRHERRRPSYSSKFDLDDIYFKDHNDAEEVLAELCDRLDDYDEVSVADLFEIAGIEGATHAHYKWGWKDLRRARNTHTRHGWGLILPDPEPLE